MSGLCGGGVPRTRGEGPTVPGRMPCGRLRNSFRRESRPPAIAGTLRDGVSSFDGECPLLGFFHDGFGIHHDELVLLDAGRTHECVNGDFAEDLVNGDHALLHEVLDDRNAGAFRGPLRRVALLAPVDVLRVVAMVADVEAVLQASLDGLSELLELLAELVDFGPVAFILAVAQEVFPSVSPFLSCAECICVIGVSVLSIMKLSGGSSG